MNNIQWTSVVFILLLGISINSCTKLSNRNPITVVETNTVKQPLQIDHSLKSEMIKENMTNIILVRHAEDEEIGADPILVAAGKTRAYQLSLLLKDIPLSAVMSTNYERTKQTAGPTAISKGLDISIYSAADLAKVGEEILKDHKNKTVLVVGHSNTTPSFANTLCGSDFEMFSEATFNNLLIVSTSEFGSGTVHHLTYGN